MALLALLAGIATILTWVMFTTKQSMLGMACTMFWAIAGGQAYTLSATTWDIYFIFAFACLLGMTTFCALGAYGLREKRDSLGDEAMERGNEEYFDEGRGRRRGLNPWMKEHKDDPDVLGSKRDKEDEFDVAARSSRRKGAERTKPARKGEFDF
tara:strand:- start:1875 stop:2336 length:462 start_codon:yes stop_codon:yes gene_type:complete